MKRFYIYLACAIASILVSSCTEMKEAEIILSTVSNSNPDGIVLFYGSYDPRCLPQKAYNLSVGAEGGELTLKCTNSYRLLIREMYDYCSDEGEEERKKEDATIDGNTYISKTGTWSATIVDDTTIKLVFEPAPKEYDGDRGLSSLIILTSPSPKGRLIEHLPIHRSFVYKNE